MFNSLSTGKLLFPYQDQPDNNIPHTTAVCVNYPNIQYVKCGVFHVKADHKRTVY